MNDVNINSDNDKDYKLLAALDLLSERYDAFSVLSALKLAFPDDENFADFPIIRLVLCLNKFVYKNQKFKLMRRAFTDNPKSSSKENYDLISNFYLTSDIGSPSPPVILPDDDIRNLSEILLSEVV